MVKTCKENEILNPKTKRCVKRTGKIGRGLVAATRPTQRTSFLTGIYIPAYIRQQKTPPIKTLTEYIETENPSATIMDVKLINKFIKTIVDEIIEITLMCCHHYRNRKDQLKRDDVVHTLKMLDVVENEKDIPQKENKEFTPIMIKLVDKYTSKDVRIEKSVYTLLSRVFQPFIKLQIQPGYVENMKKHKPSNTLEKLLVRYV